MVTRDGGRRWPGNPVPPRPIGPVVTIEAPHSLALASATGPVQPPAFDADSHSWNRVRIAAASRTSWLDPIGHGPFAGCYPLHELGWPLYSDDPVHQPTWHLDGWAHPLPRRPFG